MGGAKLVVCILSMAYSTIIYDACTTFSSTSVESSIFTTTINSSDNSSINSFGSGVAPLVLSCAILGATIITMYGGKNK